ncbi:MAG TPA: peptidoglycan editing factor PgeF [Phycisphaerae bacterium]|nr:peptidoglycan editing factor PgeF [Phycisphaerae bacterium]
MTELLERLEFAGPALETGGMKLRRVEGANGVVVYQSPLLAEAGVVHGFSTRIGGVSEGEFATLNFGNAAGERADPATHVARNFELLQEAVGAAGVARAWVKQVHGRGVELLEPEPEGEYGETFAAELRDRFSGQAAADGMVSVAPGVLLVIRTADCVPVLLASGDGKVVAAVHAGWRGVVGNIVGRAVRVMGEAGVRGEDLAAAIGPCISAEHFEVGEEVVEAFGKAELGEAVVRRDDWARPHVDLQEAVRRQLERAGVGRIDGNALCTYRDAREFFSHRRDAGKTGRMAAVIGITRGGAAEVAGAG